MKVENTVWSLLGATTTSAVTVTRLSNEILVPLLETASDYGAMTFTLMAALMPISINISLKQLEQSFQLHCHSLTLFIERLRLPNAAIPLPAAQQHNGPTSGESPFGLQQAC